MVAILELLLVQKPKGVASLNVITELTHTDGGPVITAGNGLTVIVAVAAQVPIV